MIKTADEYFTDSRIEDLVNHHNWEMVLSKNGMYKLRKKDNQYMSTADFHASDETANKYCVWSNAI